jgi:hypothetical protein
MQQTTFASVAWEKKGKVTRRERFLAEMDAVIPWSRLLALIEPHYPKPGNGTQPKPIEQMLRIYFMQNWFNLLDPQAEDSLYDIESMRRLAGIELLGHDIPDESTILRFRHLLEQHQLTERIFAEIRSLPEEKQLLLKSVTIVDATIIAAPPSTKNEQKTREPEIHRTERGKDWHFGSATCKSHEFLLRRSCCDLMNPVVPPTVPYPGMQGWQRRCVKLRRQCTCRQLRYSEP